MQSQINTQSWRTYLNHEETRRGRDGRHQMPDSVFDSEPDVSRDVNHPSLLVKKWICKVRNESRPPQPPVEVPTIDYHNLPTAGYWASPGRSVIMAELTVPWDEGRWEMPSRDQRTELWDHRQSRTCSLIQWKLVAEVTQDHPRSGSWSLSGSQAPSRERLLKTWWRRQKEGAPELRRKDPTACCQLAAWSHYRRV